MTYKITAINDNERMSTQTLVQLISSKIEEGETNFEIEACGQHDIASAVWNKNKKDLNFHIKNPGQRVGAMGMEGTTIIVEGSAPADIGWLNSGAKIIIKGDGGDTASHCAAGGKIYVGGKVGTRSGALMKQDPKFEPPEFWVLKNTGSFSFEFMNGGIAVICGYDCDNINSVLGNRSCVGMVGGVVYVRGQVNGLAKCVEQLPLEKLDKDFLLSGMKDFLKSIDKFYLENELLDFSKWSKIVPLSKDVKAKKITVKEFKQQEWFDAGLFGDLIDDNGDVFGLAETGDARLRKPIWDSKLCVGCNLCIQNCPQRAITKNADTYISNDNKCIGCGICEAVCPQKAWSLHCNI